LRARIGALVENAALEALQECEAVLLGQKHMGKGVGHGASRRKKLASPAGVSQSPSELLLASSVQLPDSAGYPEAATSQIPAHDEGQVLVVQPQAGADDSVRDGDGRLLRMMDYSAKFVHSISCSTLFVDPYERYDVTGQQVVDDIKAQFEKYLEDVQGLRAAGKESEANDFFCFGRRFILPKYYEEMLIGESCNPKLGVVELYSAETGVYPAVNKVVYDRDESKVGFRSYVRLLHDTLSNPIHPMCRWNGACYRWMRVSEEMLSRYDVQTYELNNYISFGGFASASRTCEAAWWNRVQFSQDCNMLFIIKQDNTDIGPIDISLVSQYPEEAEVLYAQGQTFRKDRTVVMTFDELCTHLSAPPVNDDYSLEFFDCGSSPVHVVYLTAVDVFHELAKDLKRGGGTAGEALPLLERRLKQDIDSSHKAKMAEARTLLTLGKAHRGAGEYDKAMGLINRSKELRFAIEGERPETLAEYLYEEAHVFESKGDGDSKRPPAERSLAIRREHLGERHPDTADSMLQVAKLEGESAERLELYKSAMEIYRETLGSRHPKVAQCLQFVGQLTTKRGDSSGALPLYEECVSIRKESLGDNHPALEVTLHDIGVLYRMLGDFASALPALQQSLAMKKRTLGDKHAGIANSLFNIGLTKRHLGDFGEAMSALEESLKIDRKHFGSNHERVAVTLEAMGGVYKDQKHFRKARDTYLEAAGVFLRLGKFAQREKNARIKAADCNRRMSI